MQSHIDEAVVWLEMACSANPAHSHFHGYLASAYALRGDIDHAAAELAEARRLHGDGGYTSMARMRAQNSGVIRALFEATHYVGLRKAGMPEE